MKRNHWLILRSPEGSLNEMNVNLFYENLEQISNTQFTDGTLIFNLDKTSTFTIQKHQKLYTEEACKQGRKFPTVVTCGVGCSNGNALPPVIMFPRAAYEQGRFIWGSQSC
jgi:hypothetical protein